LTRASISDGWKQVCGSEQLGRWRAWSTSQRPDKPVSARTGACSEVCVLPASAPSAAEDFDRPTINRGTIARSHFRTVGWPDARADVAVAAADRAGAARCVV
jgi:hypothetical protein